MNEYQQKFFDGLKTLEAQTGYTVIGSTWGLAYIVPIEEPRPYGRDVAALICKAGKGLVKKE